MTMRKTSLVMFFIFLGLLLSCGRQHSAPPSVNLAPVDDMLVTLVTRSGATNPAYFEALSANIGSSSTAFRSSINNDLAFQSFSESLPPILSTFRTEYSAATTSTEKGNADDSLFRGILQAADGAGIGRASFELALLSAFAHLQPKLSLPPLSTAFSDTDRELVNLLMIFSSSQVHRRSVLHDAINACTALDIDTVLSDHFIQTTNILDSSLLIDLSTFEESVISNALILADSSSLITWQWNCDAINDLFLFRYQLELAGYANSVSWEPILSRIVSRMDTIGGVMSGMTVTTLVQSGIAASNPPYWTFSEYFVYDWVRPQKSLSYQPSVDLADQVIQMGGTMPSLPDWNYFTDPYLAVFHVKYDFDLSNIIDGLEYTQASSTTTVPLTMQVRYALRKSQVDRHCKILSRLGDIAQDKRTAIKTFFSNRH